MGIYKENSKSKEEASPCFLKLEKGIYDSISVRCVDEEGNNLISGHIVTFRKENGKYEMHIEPGVNEKLPFRLDTDGKIVLR